MLLCYGGNGIYPGKCYGHIGYLSMRKCCVLIPYYNAREALLDSIGSIDQDYFSPDVIVVDDGSDLHPADEVLGSYSGTLAIKLLVLEKNSGLRWP